MRGAGAIWQALAAARRQDRAARGLPPPLVAPPGLTRRRLIAGLAATAGAPVLARPARADPNPIVAIVGGGLAGLVALDTLTAAGIDATLYEARARPGGRIRTSVGALGAGLAVDDGGQLVNSDHADVRALCARFGLPLVDRQSGPSRGIVLDGGIPAEQAALVAALSPLAVRIAKDAERAEWTGAAAFDRLSAAAYLDRIGARGIVRTLLENSIRTEYGAEPGETTALGLLWNLPTVDGAAFETLGGSDERYAIAGGSQMVTDALAALHAARIRTGRTLVRIGEAGGRLALRFADGETVLADRAILALPAGLAKRIAFEVRLPTPWRALIDELALGRVEKLVIGCDRRPWLDAFGPAGELWAGPGFAEAWDATGGQPALTGGAFAFLPGGAQVEPFFSADMGALATRWTAAAERAVPGLAAARNGHVRRTAWARDPHTGGAYVTFRPGQLTRFAPLLWSDAPGPLSGGIGRLAFAGEHLSDAFPGYMNGAAETGRLAAERIVVEARRAVAA